MPVSPRAPGGALLLAVLAGAAAGRESAQDPGCSWVPLVAQGSAYLPMAPSMGQQTTCSEVTEGRCPYTVPFPGFPCLVNCIRTSDDCLQYNMKTVTVNPYVDSTRCVSCDISGCASCKFDNNSVASCAACFDDFVLAEDQKSCVLWDQSGIYTSFSVMTCLLAVLGVMTLICTCFGAITMSWHFHGHVPGHPAWAKTLSNSRDTEKPSELESPLLPTQDTQCSQDQRCQDHKMLNIRAIHAGLNFSLVSSMRFSQMRSRNWGQVRNVKGSMKRRFTERSLELWTRCDSMTDAGLGLQLFFRTQEFLFVISCVFVMGSFCWNRVWHDYITFEELSLEFEQQCSQTLYNQSAVLQGPKKVLDMRMQYASDHVYLCASAWVVALLLSWLFHYRQRRFIRKYDKTTLSSEDYTLRLSGLPEDLTSEKALKRMLEKELRMENNIHGVCIIYNLLALPPEDIERIEDMIEHIVEADDLDNDWVHEELSTGTDKLKKAMEKDKEFLIDMMTKQEGAGLKSSGEAYVVFKKQRDMVQIVNERRGINYNAFKQDADSSDDVVSPVRSTRNFMFHAASIVGEVDGDQMVKVHASDDEPAGIRFWDFKENSDVYFRRRYIWIPIRMIIYITVYAIAAHLFYWCEIKPFQDHEIEGAEGSVAIKLVSKAVLLLNFTIQTVVMVDVERGKHRRTSLVDKITFVWNTVLLLVTCGYLIVQQTYHKGMQWSVSPPVADDGPDEWWQCTASSGGACEELWRWLRIAFESVPIENQVGQHLAGVMTEQILLLYVLGEVANVLLPVGFYWVALRCIFVYNIGGYADHPVQKALRSMLPRSASKSVVTAREAERAQILMPLLLWMEYTYVVLFAAMAFISFYVVSDMETTLLVYLCVFSLIFFIWQRYIMLWLYGKATYDSAESYEAFIWFWGVVVSVLPPASVVWAGRLGWVKQFPCVVLIVILVFMLVLLIYWIGIWTINYATEEPMEEADDGDDPGYSQVIEEQCASWWNMNPIYVLKQRHCPELEGWEVHDGDDCWPRAHIRKGFFEPGKEFRHEPRGQWMESAEARRSWNPGVRWATKLLLGEDAPATPATSEPRGFARAARAEAAAAPGPAAPRAGPGPPEVAGAARRRGPAGGGRRAAGPGELRG